MSDQNQAEQQDKLDNAQKVVITHECLTVQHNPDIPLHNRDEDALYILIRFMRSGQHTANIIDLEEAKTWLNNNGHNPRDCSVATMGLTSRTWHPV